MNKEICRGRDLVFQHFLRDRGKRRRNTSLCVIISHPLSPPPADGATSLSPQGWHGPQPVPTPLPVGGGVRLLLPLAQYTGQTSCVRISLLLTRDLSPDSASFPPVARSDPLSSEVSSFPTHRDTGCHNSTTKWQEPPGRGGRNDTVPGG